MSCGFLYRGLLLRNSFNSAGKAKNQEYAQSEHHYFINVTFLCFDLLIYLQHITPLTTDNIQQHFLDTIRQHTGILHKVCRLYCHIAEDRQDLFQEMVAQVWKAFPGFRNEAKISTWIYRIALNTAISDFRKKQRKISTVALAAGEISAIYREDATAEKERSALMQQAIDRLSDVEKALVMLYLEDKSYEEMEDILGMSQGNLRVKMNRIKEKLRKNVAGYEKE